MSVGFVWSPIKSFSPPIGRMQDRLAVEQELELVRILEAADGAQVRAIEPDLELVLAIDGERVSGGHAADGAERQAVEVHVL